jgi:AraC family transcriptional regulator of adaptative response / DNA-3-methyladenine glycosylase II
METNSDQLYEAFVSRDARFDGKFFAGVRTTGIYCRPVCPAPPPKKGNVEFFVHAAAAEEAGFRPCWRCRPETAPGTPAWIGTSATVTRALRLISDGALDRGSVEDLAARVGVGGRHLRRLFERHLGASPIAIAQARRVHFARNLLDETDLSMHQVACAAGFANVRRFNAVLRATFDKTPSELRRTASREPETLGDGAIRLRLRYRAPYDWEGLFAYLEQRAIPGVEWVGDGMYRRSVVLDGQPAVVEVRPEPEQQSVAVRLPSFVRRDLMEVVERVRRVFDLSADPMQIASRLGKDPFLSRAVAARPGVRVPAAWDPFELAVRAILGQQVSVKGATTLAGRLVEAFGVRIDGTAPEGPSHLFPTPAALAEAEIGKIGMPRSRGRAINELARRVRDDELPLSWGECPIETHKRLVQIPGIGEWTAQYIAMRGLGQPDTFMAGDLGVRRALADASGNLPTPQQAAALAEAWRPWRAYAVFYLWTAPEHC